MGASVTTGMHFDFLHPPTHYSQQLDQQLYSQLIEANPKSGHHPAKSRWRRLVRSCDFPCRFFVDLIHQILLCFAVCHYLQPVALHEELSVTHIPRSLLVPTDRSHGLLSHLAKQSYPLFPELVWR